MNTLKDSKQILLSYINCTFKQDIYYELAILLLKHEKEISNYSIDKIAQLCFVSTSTLSRFCRKLGFQNYNEFKNGFQQNYKVNNYSIELFQQINKDINKASFQLLNDIYDTMKSQIENIDLADIDWILDQIYKNKTVLFLGHQFLQSIGNYFQQNLLRFDKLSYSFNQEADQIQFLKHINDNTVVIILSIDGSYHLKHNDIMEVLLKKNITIILITQNKYSQLTHYCDKSLILKGSNKNDIGKYGMLFLIDFMLLRYKNLYVDSKNNHLLSLK